MQNGTGKIRICGKYSGKSRKVSTTDTRDDGGKVAQGMFERRNKIYGKWSKEVKNALKGVGDGKSGYIYSLKRTKGETREWSKNQTGLGNSEKLKQN